MFYVHTSNGSTLAKVMVNKLCEGNLKPFVCISAFYEGVYGKICVTNLLDEISVLCVKLNKSFCSGDYLHVFHEVSENECLKKSPSSCGLGCAMLRVFYEFFLGCFM